MEAAQKLVPFSAYDLTIEYARAPRLSGWRRVVVKSITMFSRASVAAIPGQSLRYTLDEFSRRLSERALAISALVEEIREGELDERELDPEDVLRSKLESAEADFDAITRSVENLLRYGERILYANEADRCARSALAAATAIRELKGAIQAHDANVSALRRAAHRTARTAAELETQLTDAFGS